MTPTQFCIWLQGYAAAKPEVLDPKVREELDGIIAHLVASKLAGPVDDAYERDFGALRRYDLELQKKALEQAQRQLAQPVIYTSKVDFDTTGYVPKQAPPDAAVEKVKWNAGSTRSCSSDRTAPTSVV